MVQRRVQYSAWPDDEVVHRVEQNHAAGPFGTQRFLSRALSVKSSLAVSVSSFQPESLSLTP